MPFLNLDIEGAEPSSQALDQVQKGLTSLMAQVLRKRADLTVVRVNVRAVSRLWVGGRPLPAGSWSGRLVVHVTEGTNTAEEMAMFLAAAHDLIAQQLSRPASPFYVVIQAVPATSWGYDGLTQAARAAAPMLEAAA